MSKQKRLPADKRKRVILRAAIDVFSESNYRVAKVSDIAARAGVTDPMIYKFFDSKKSLFLEILMITNRKSIELFGIQNFITEDSFDNVKNLRLAFKKFLLMYFASMEKYRKELKVFYQAISEIDDPDIQRVIRGTYENIVDIMVPVLQKGIDKGLLSGRLEPEMIAWDIIGFTIQQNALFLAGLYNVRNADRLLTERMNSWFS